MAASESAASTPVLGAVLGLDTCGAESTLALAKLDGGAPQRLRDSVLGARSAGSLLTGAIRDLLAPAAPCDLGAMVVVRGPGSFTGMRIGLSAAKALSEACTVPLVAVSRLFVLAQTSGAPVVALDAGRGSVYLRSLTRVDGEQPGSAEERLVTAELAREAVAHAPQGTLAVCEPKLQLLFPEARLVPAPGAFDAICCAYSRLRAGDWDDAATLDALYLWRKEQMLQPSARQF